MGRGRRADVDRVHIGPLDEIERGIEQGSARYQLPRPIEAFARDIGNCRDLDILERLPGGQVTVLGDAAEANQTNTTHRLSLHRGELGRADEDLFQDLAARICQIARQRQGRVNAQ